MPFAAAQGSLWTRPSGQVGWPFEIDWSHPQSMALEECIIATPMGMIDAVSAELGTRSGTGDAGSFREESGLFALFDGVDDWYAFSAGNLVDSAAEFTICWEGWIDGTIDAYATIVIYPSLLGSGLRLLYRAANTSFVLRDGATNLAAFTLPAAVGTNDRVCGVWSYAPGAGHALWINGLACATATTQATSGVANARRVGSASSAGADYFGGIRQVRRYLRAWSADEAGAFGLTDGANALFIGGAIRPGVYGGPLFGSATGAGEATGGAVPQVDVSLMADGFAVAGGSADLSSSIPPTMVQDSRYTVRAPLRDYRVAMPQRNRAA